MNTDSEKIGAFIPTVRAIQWVFIRVNPYYYLSEFAQTAQISEPYLFRVFRGWNPFPSLSRSVCSVPLKSVSIRG